MRMGLFKHLFSLAVVAGSALLLSNTASATAITGELNTTGAATVTATTISFVDNANNPGQFQVGIPATGVFAGAGGMTGTIDPSISLGTPPVPAFITVPLANPVFLDLESFKTTGGTVNGFTLSQNGNSVGVLLTGNFLGYTGTSATGATSYIGSFTTQINNSTIATVLATIGSGGSITSSYSATFDPAPMTGTPEPASMLMLGSGLLGVAFLSRRYAKR